jgi:L-malate glycosyltransferase
MVGPTLDASEVECRALGKELGLNGELRLTGMLTKAELRHIAADYDIFINTTNVDNTPMSVLEAMALGLPVVSTNVGGIPYLLEDGKEGLLTPPSDYMAMTANIQRLLNDNELSISLATNALKKAGIFDKVNVIKQWQAILK